MILKRLGQFVGVPITEQKKITHTEGLEIIESLPESRKYPLYIMRRACIGTDPEIVPKEQIKECWSNLNRLYGPLQLVGFTGHIQRKSYLNRTEYEISGINDDMIPKWTKYEIPNKGSPELAKTKELSDKFFTQDNKSLAPLFYF